MAQAAGRQGAQASGKQGAQASGNQPRQAASASQSFGNQDVMRHGLIKVPAAPREADGRENIYRRVAKFLLLIGTDEAAKVISHLSPEQTERIIPEIVSIRRIDPDEASVILEEFKTLLDNARQQGGVATARNILEKAFGSDRAEELISKAVPFPEGVPFDYLQEMDGERVFLLLKDEPPPVQTLVLSRLKPAVAAEVINQLDSDQKKEIIRRLAKLAPMDPEILRRVDKAMHEKVLMMNTHAADSMDGRGALTEILKRMSPNAEKDILTALADLDPDLSNDIRDRLFTMDDILMADDRFIQKKLHTMGEGEIALLIAGKPESFRQKILSNVSKNRGDVILEEEVLRRPMRRRDCDEVTARFFSILRRAWEEGSLIIHGRSDDIYV
ncbi:MAG: flagellar motor switch protein FliG [Treponema sp.]|nr:flagellar motor switch protein FliG [Treponema sp.]